MHVIYTQNIKRRILLMKGMFMWRYICGIVKLILLWLNDRSKVRLKKTHIPWKWKILGAYIYLMNDDNKGKKLGYILLSLWQYFSVVKVRSEYVLFDVEIARRVTKKCAFAFSHTILILHLIPIDDISYIFVFNSDEIKNDESFR